MAGRENQKLQPPTGERGYALGLLSTNSNMTACKCIFGSSEKCPAIPCGLPEYNDGRWMGKCSAITCLTVMIHVWLEGWPQQTERLQGSHDLFLMSTFSIFI